MSTVIMLAGAFLAGMLTAYLCALLAFRWLVKSIPVEPERQEADREP